jgi:hypothetical protein
MEDMMELTDQRASSERRGVRPTQKLTNLRALPSAEAVD